MIDVMQRLRGFLDDRQLIDGLTVRYFRWTDADIEKGGDLVLFRPDSGGGESDPLLQRPAVQIALLKSPSDVVDGDATMRAITTALRSDEQPPAGVVRFDLMGHPQGPFYFDDGRAWWRLIVRVFVQDH